MSRYDHKIETSLEGIEHLSKEKNQEIESFSGTNLPLSQQSSIDISHRLTFTAIPLV